MNGRKAKKMRREAKRVAEKHKDAAKIKKMPLNLFERLLYKDIKRGN